MVVGVRLEERRVAQPEDVPWLGRGHGAPRMPAGPGGLPRDRVRRTAGAGAARDVGHTRLKYTMVD